MTPGKNEPARGVIILGALSAIAEAAGREWALRGERILLAGRDKAKLQAVADDLSVRGASCQIFEVDFAESNAAAEFAQMWETFGGAKTVLLAYGSLGDQRAAECNPAEAGDILKVNFLSAAGWCLAAANALERQGLGTLIVIGSVAGDRGRASNYIYGAAKGGLAVLVQGLAHRLAKVGGRAILIKPGFVNTPMTAHFARKGPLWAQPDAIGRIIVRASESRSSNRTTIYAPGFWRWIMLIVRNVPDFVFHRTRL